MFESLTRDKRLFLSILGMNCAGPGKSDKICVTTRLSCYVCLFEIVFMNCVIVYIAATGY